MFGAKFAFMQRVTDLRRELDRLFVTLSEGGQVSARAVLLATGAAYRRLGLPALDALNGAGVFYGSAVSAAPAMAGQNVHVLGGANSAGQAALYLARYAQRVTLVVRAQSLGAGMSHYLVRQVEATPNLQVRLGTEIVGGGGAAGAPVSTLADTPTDRAATWVPVPEGTDFGIENLAFGVVRDRHENADHSSHIGPARGKRSAA